MDDRQFSLPVRVIAEPGQDVMEIYNVEQALAFLQQWPLGRQGPIYKTALNCCRHASEGKMKADEARQSFASFARITGILAKDSFDAISIDRYGNIMGIATQR